MERSHVGGFIIFLVGVGAGLAIANLPAARASVEAPATDLAVRQIAVSVDEIKQNFVFAELFKGSYSHTFALSDGSIRAIELTPMVRDGMQVIRLNDTGTVSYMAINGSASNDNLMIKTWDVEAFHNELKAQGWFRRK
jgi:hypothetical protein